MVINMKKRNLFLIAALLLPVFFSCQKEEPTKDTSFELKASLENGRIWNEGDVVLLNGKRYSISDKFGTPNTTIPNVEKSSEYTAAYDFGEGTVSDNILSLNLPTNITEDTMIQPMVAFSDNNSLNFKHVLGFLKIKLSGSAVIKSLNLTSVDPAKKLSGSAQVDMYVTSEPKIEMSSDANANLSLDFGAEGLDLSKAERTVIVPLPPANYDEGFNILIYDAEGKAMDVQIDYGVKIARGMDLTLSPISYVPGSDAPLPMTCVLENDAFGAPSIWTSSDLVSANGIAYSLISGEGSSSASFGPVVRADSYVFVSPANAYNGFAERFAKVRLSENQHYGESITSMNPQVGFSNDDNVDMKYVAGLLTVRISGNNIIDRIQLISQDKSKKISGKMDVVYNGSDFTTSMNNDGKTSIVLDCPGGVSTQGGKDFNFVIPEGDYPQGFKLVLTNKRQQMQSVETGSVTVKRNEVSKLSDISWTPSADTSGDLSAFGWANCYIVPEQGKYSFETKLIDGNSVNGIVKVDWLWANSVKGNAQALVSDIIYKDGKVTFTSSGEEGNVLLAAFNSSNEIVWSWHIWLTDEPSTINTMNFLPKDPSLGYFVMDRNLGATSANQADGEETYGLFYQWGRKDPFYGGTKKERIADETGNVLQNDPFKNAKEGTVCNTKYPQAVWTSNMGTKEQGTIDFATKNPMFFLAGTITSGDNNWLEKEQPMRKNYDSDLALWRPFEKSIYDPCPVGYQIPRKGVWDVLEPKTDGKWVADYSGFVYTNSESGESTWFPAQGMRVAHPESNGALEYLDSEKSNMIGVWTSEQMTANPSCRSHSLNINTVLTNSQASDDAWGYGLNVRCVKVYEYKN